MSKKKAVLALAIIQINMSFTILKEKKVKIKKKHKCFCCLTTTHPPAVMHYQTAIFDGDFSDSYQCEICNEFMTPKKWRDYEYEMRPGDIWEDYEYAAFREQYKCRDDRYRLVKERLETCSNEELQRIIDDVDHICWDTFNFDKETNTYCPIAIAMNLHHELLNPTDELVMQKINERFDPTNILKGTPGIFYTANRKQDILKLCHEILLNRKQNT